MPITVGELVDLPHLQLRVCSGAGGLDREVTWTHTTDLPKPWQWVAGGELLMTNGMSIPTDPAGQQKVLRELYAHDVAALAIGEKMSCPPLTPEMKELSDELMFPLLWIAYPMPFVSISRTVAEATLLEQSQRLIRTERIYRALQEVPAADGHLGALMSGLAKELGCSVTVCDKRSGWAWTGDEETFDERLRHAVAEAPGRLRAGMTAVRASNGDRLLMVDVPTHTETVLVCVVDDDYQPDAVLLQHSATVVALALHQVLLTIENRRRTGAELLLQVLDGHVSESAFRNVLRSHGIDVTTAVVLAASSQDEEPLRRLHVHLWRRSVPHLTVQRSETTVSVIPDNDAHVSTYLDILGPTGRVGVSESLMTASRFYDARREAAWALGVAVEDPTALVRYGTTEPMLGPKTPEEAAALVTRVLGPVRNLRRGDPEELLRTLSTFMEHQRSWQRTADELHVHRQTVRYRIRKVESLIGRRTNDTGDVAAIWIALRAMRHLPS